MKLRLSVSLLFLVLMSMFGVGSAFAAVAVPTPQSPAAGANVTSPVTISWSTVTDPSGLLGYNWQVSTSATFPTIAAQNSTNAGITHDVVSGLANGTYFWRVQAVSGAFVKSAWSQPLSFNITGVGAGQPGSPTMGPTKGYSTFHPLEVMTFNWSPVAGAASYTLQFSTDQSFPVSTRGEFNNIPNPTFSFSTPNEGFYFARVIAVNANGIASAPSNTINFTVFYSNPLPPAPKLLSPANGAAVALPFQLSWTDVLNPQPSGYELQIARDSGFTQIEEEAPQLNDPRRTELSLTPGQKFWRVRSAQGDASPTTAAVTAFSAAGTFTVNAAPPTPVSITLLNDPLFSGDTTFVQLQLSGAAPAAGTVISLTSSNPTAVPVPTTVTMPGNTAFTQFQITAGQVVSPTPVTITATLNSGTATAQFNLMPPSIKSLIINPTSISGGAQAGAVLMLNGQAPAGGAVIDLSSSSAAALPPASATVLAGNSSVSFSVPTNNVTASTLATITASWNGGSAQDQITVTPQGQPASITLSPATVTGSAGSFATVRIAAPSATDQIFQMTSSNPSVASMSSSVQIPA